MAAIPLISAVFDVSAAEAQRYVVWSTAHYREVDMEYKQYVHMPETSEQTQAAFSLEPYVRKQSR